MRVSLYENLLVREGTMVYSAINKTSAKNYNTVDAFIDGPSKTVTVLRDVLNLHNKSQEELWVIALNTKNKITGFFMASRGSSNMSVVDPADIFKFALLQGATGIILAHNHPSGNPAPSGDDISSTKRLVDCGRLLNITVTDHIIVGHNAYHSLRENGDSYFN